MKIIKICLKSMLFIVFVFVIWYFQIFSKFENHNVKNIIGLFSLRNNFSESNSYINESGYYEIDNELISLSIKSRKLDKVTINLYDKNRKIINSLKFRDCILHKNNTCTYLVEEYNTKFVQVSNYSGNIINVNNTSYISMMKKNILLKFAFSLFMSLIILVTIHILHLYKVDYRIKNTFNNLNINIIFSIIALIVGLTTSILIPIYQVPDELTHINMIYKERGIDNEFQNSIKYSTGTEGVATHSSKQVDLSEYFNLSNTINIKKSIGVPRLTLIRHLPQTVGMLIGELLNLPVFLYVTLVEIFSLLFYIIICNIALKIIPLKKNLMMFIMLLPVAIQQMASFSYDVVLNSFCFLFVSYVLYLKYKNSVISNKEIIKLLFMVAVIAICKIPYAVIGLIIFTLPIKNFCISLSHKKIRFDDIKEAYKSNRVFYTLVGLLVIALLLIIGIKLILKIDIGRVFIASCINVFNTISLYARSLNIFLPYYFDTISGNLGWFDTKFPFLFQLFVYITMFIVTFSSGVDKCNISYLFRKRDKVIFYTVGCFLIYIIILSMFEWTLKCSNVVNYDKLSVGQYAQYIKTLPYIGGVQGRYFLPVLPLLLLPMSSLKFSRFANSINPILYQIVYYCFLVVVMVSVLLNRYWI